jgi:hypothetical protein
MNEKKKYKWVVLLLAFLAMTAGAQEFTHIDWSHAVSEGAWPKVNETVNLGVATKNAAFTVSVDYPVFEPLTKQELGLVKKLKPTASDTIQYQWNVGVSRKMLVGDMSLLPIVKRGNKWLKLVSFKFSVKNAVAHTSLRTIESGTATTSRYAAHSVLTSGRWVKIRVSTEGVYELTPSLLKQMGFASPDKVKVYGYGGQVENMVISYTGKNADFDDLEEIPLLRRSSGLLFYANGPLKWTDWTYSSQAKRYVSERVINPYSSYSYYFVTEGENPQTLVADSSAVSVSGTVVTSYPEHLLIEKDAYSWYTSGRNLFDSYDFVNGNSKNYSLLTPDADTTRTAWATVVMTASGSSSTSVKVSLNAQSLSTSVISAVGQYDHAMMNTIKRSSKIVNGENILNIQTTAGHNARLDYISLNYDRQLKLNGSFLSFSHYLTGGQRMQLSGADAATQIWRIGAAGDAVKQIPSTLSGTTLTFNVSDPTRRYVAVNTAATFPTPEVIGKIENQDLHGDSAADMVIIIPTSGKLQAQAERLAEGHQQKDKMRVRIVRADQLYNEFSSGTPDAGAYRRYLKMLYDRAETEADMPRYLLLFGSCVWDCRMLSSGTKGMTPDDYLLCYESENSISEVSSYVSDDFFGLLDDGEGNNIISDKLDVGIGRIPVSTAGDAEIIVDKTLAYMENSTTGVWKNAIYMMADDGDNNEHMIDEETVTKEMEEEHPAMLVKRIYWDSYKRVTTSTGNTYPEVVSTIKNVMKKGALVMNYSGHGSPYMVSHEQVLLLEDFKNFSSARIPMWIFASCELTPYDMPVENIGESSLLNKSGAAIAFYSASRAVYSDLNRYVNKKYMHFLLGSDNNGKRYSIGDAARLAKVYLVTSDETGEQDYTINKLKYALMGDPALTLSMPKGKVVLDEVNGVSLSSGENPQLKGGSVAHLKGHVESASGERLPSFNGMVTLTLQDSKDTVTCKNNDGSATKPYVFYERTKTLYEGSDSVRNGTFETSIPIPLDINYTNQSGRVNMYAVNKDKSVEVNGYSEEFTIGGSETVTEKDSLGPAMFAYLNNPDFRDGGTVNETPYFYAVLSDTDGINTTGNGVGHDLEIIIDGDENKTYILNDYYENDFGSYTRGTVSFHIPTLEDGKHRLFFRAWDLKNHSSSTILNFVVQTGLRPSLLDVNASKNPASTSTTFIISYDRPDTETQFTVEVYDCFGRLWWKDEETGTSAGGYYTIDWDLTSNSGIPLPSGLYLYKVGISCNGSKESTKTKKILVHRQ